MVLVEAFKAIEHFDKSKEFIIGHRHVLEAFDIANITSASLDWAFSPTSTIITIRRPDSGKLIGGARLQISDGNLLLPMEEAIMEMDESVHAYIAEKRENGGVAEICGLWNTREGARLGVGSLFLTRAAFVVSRQLNVKSVAMLCAPSTVNMAKNIGCEIITSLGNEGKFYYPKLDLIATAMIKHNMMDLSNIIDDEQTYVRELMSNPNQIKKSVNRKGQVIEVDYRLNVKAEV